MHVLFDGNSANEDVVCSFVLLTSWMRVQNVVCAFVESTDCIMALMGGGHRVVFCLPYNYQCFMFAIYKKLSMRAGTFI